MRGKLRAVAGAALAVALGAAAQAAPPISTDGTDPKTWDPKTDGPIAAPANHKVVFESDTIRIMSVTVLPGQSEPLHAHLKCAVLVFDRPTKIVNRDGHGNVLTDAVVLAQIPWQAPGAPKQVPFVWLQPPEALHSITNIDTHALHLTRVEMKNGCDAPPA
ncbi:MAG TPA: hypothetical protein VMU59_08115 [Caulobacteraceae bacterium]|nr:hypothetical protein [Caulobacteraceae bacterium]